jgi:hypothetical protein
MPKILCTLPNASTEISGVKFAPHDESMLSEEVSLEVAESFAAIDGYKVVADDAPAAAKPAAVKAPSRSKKSAPESPSADSGGDGSSAAGAEDQDPVSGSDAGPDDGADAIGGESVF